MGSRLVRVLLYPVPRLCIYTLRLVSLHKYGSPTVLFDPNYAGLALLVSTCLTRCRDPRKHCVVRVAASPVSGPTMLSLYKFLMTQLGSCG